MDQILTIISEYNPLHNGHLYHINETLKIVDTKYKACIISGCFVQRGEPSLIDKWTKTRMALEAGFDIVIELPTLYCLSSAENYASGAIKIAKQIGTNYLSFGSETGDISLLENLTMLIEQNHDEYYKEIKDYISKGYSYPKAQELVINKMFGRKYALLCTPNNILALEYLRSIKQLKANIKPITIKRNEKFKSATDIRNSVLNNKGYKSLVPPFTYEALKNNKNKLGTLKVFEKEILYKLRTMSIDDIKLLPDIPENLISKLKTASGNCNTLDQLLLALKNKSITAARIKRILLYVLLDITSKDIDISKEVIPYIRVLGIKRDSKQLLSDISKKRNVITSVKDFEKTCKNKKLLRLLEIDKTATDIYTLGYNENSKTGLDYTEKLIIF